MSLINILSKKARENIPYTTTTELLSDRFRMNNPYLTQRDKQLLSTISESYKEYATEQIKGETISITNAQRAVGYFQKMLSGSTVEKMMILALNAKNEVVATDTLYVGTADAAVTHPREIFNFVIKHSAVTYMIAHNHPSGHLDPSSADLHFTERLIHAGMLMGVPLLDHLIITDGDYLSIRREYDLWDVINSER